MKIIERIKTKIRGTIDLDKLEKDGFIHGKNFDVQGGCIIDPGHCWLIECGDNVTLAPNVHILAHDAATKKFLGYTKIANVIIGNNVFIGAGTIILPGSIIGDNIIIGAGSVVLGNLESNGIYVGNPIRKISDFDSWIIKKEKQIKSSKVYGQEFTYGKISSENKKKMKEELVKETGYII